MKANKKNAIVTKVLFLQAILSVSLALAVIRCGKTAATTSSLPSQISTGAN